MEVISLYVYVCLNMSELCLTLIFSADQRLLEESTASICKNFAINNCQTGNLGSLIQVFLMRATELKDSAQCEE